MKMPAVAITDHGNLFGAIDFYQCAKAAGIKPIIGCEAYMAPRLITDRKNRQRECYLPFHLAGGKRDGLSQFGKADFGGASGRILLPAADRQGIARGACATV